MCTFGVKIYPIVCLPLNTPSVQFLQYHRAASEGWESSILCDEFSEEIQRVLQQFVGNCSSDRSCRCNVCLRQPQSLRNLASHTVFHYTFNLSQFTVSDRILYHKYLYAMESQKVSEDDLVPLTVFTLSSMKYTFVLDKRRANNKLISPWLCNPFRTLLFHNKHDVLWEPRGCYCDME